MNCCACNRPCISAYTQQLCAIKSKLSLIEDLQAEMNSANSKKGCDCSCCCCSMQLALISLLKDIIDKCVTEDEFNEYKRWIEAQGYLKAIPDYYITEEELKEILKNLFRDGWNRELQAILEDYVKKADLPDYIRRWMDQNLANYLANYVTRPELNNYYTKALIDSMFGDYYTKAQVDALLRGLQTELPDLSGYALKSDFSWSPNPEIETATGRYKLGEIVLAGRTYSVYGKDNLGSGNNGLDGSDGQGGSSGSDGVSGETITIITEKVNLAIEDLKNSINEQNSWADRYVRDIIADALKHKDWMLQNTKLDEIYHIGDEDAWDNTLKLYMRETGLTTTNQSGETVYLWSQWMLKFDQMFLSVSALVDVLDEEGNATTLRELFDSRFSQWASDLEVGVDLTSLATMFNIDGESGKTGPEVLQALMNFALVGWRQYATLDANGLAEAWLSLKTLGQNNQQGGGFATNSGLDSAVNNALGKATASISASTTIYEIYTDDHTGFPILRDAGGNTRYPDSNGEYEGTGPYTVIYVDSNGNALQEDAPIESRVIKDQNLSGFITSSDLESSIATMFASGGEKMASITTGVINNLTDPLNNGSFIQMVADQILVDAPNTTFKGNVQIETGQSQTAASNGIIYLGKDGNQYPILTVTPLNSRYPSFGVYTDPNTTRYTLHDGVANALFADGSGRFAHGQLSWASTGALSIGNTQINNADISTTTTQSINITQLIPNNRALWSAGGQIGIYLSFGGGVNIPVKVDGNGFLKVDLDMITG